MENKILSTRIQEMSDFINEIEKHYADYQIAIQDTIFQILNINSFLGKLNIEQTKYCLDKINELAEKFFVIHCTEVCCLPMSFEQHYYGILYFEKDYEGELTEKYKTKKSDMLCCMVMYAENHKTLLSKCYNILLPFKDNITQFEDFNDEYYRLIRKFERVSALVSKYHYSLKR